MKHFLRVLAGTLAVAAALLPTPGEAQTRAAVGPWQYRASIYGYFPTITGSTSVPTGGSSLEFDGDIIDSIKGAFMGSFEAHNGRWGVFTDFMYLNLGDDQQNSRNFTIGGSGLAADTSANIGWDVEGTIWTLAGQYRLQSTPALTMDLLVGFRMFDLETSTRWDISGSIGTLPPASRTGSSTSSETLWDGIIGVKGRYAFGAGQRWSVPFYLDIGTGESSLTWQAAAGISYAFSWGEITGMWRYLAYDMKSGQSIQDMKFNGPMVGATFKF